MNNVFQTLKKAIREIQEQQSYPLIEVTADANLVNDLGLASLDLAQLVAMMETELGVDPFAAGATLDQVATVKDLCRLYSAEASAQ